MDLANMRSMGVRSVSAWCSCGRQATVNVDALDGAVALPSLKGRLRCTCCGATPQTIMPDWTEERVTGNGGFRGT
jgi:hypothetical protein